MALRRYLLDTDICIHIARKKPSQVLERLKRLAPGEVAMSVVTYGELIYGCYRSRETVAALAGIEELRAIIPVEPMDAGVALCFGRIRAELEAKGTPIGAYDLMIAAHSLSLGLILVTNNVREFGRVEGLRIENWIVSAA